MFRARANSEATEFEQRRYRSLDAGDQLHVLYLIPAGEAGTLGEAIKMASASFEEFLRRRHRDARRERHSTAGRGP
jgi:hypothetical protein